MADRIVGSGRADGGGTAYQGGDNEPRVSSGGGRPQSPRDVVLRQRVAQGAADRASCPSLLARRDGDDAGDVVDEPRGRRLHGGQSPQPRPLVPGGRAVAQYTPDAGGLTMAKPKKLEPKRKRSALATQDARTIRKGTARLDFSDPGRVRHGNQRSDFEK